MPDYFAKLLCSVALILSFAFQPCMAKPKVQQRKPTGEPGWKVEQSYASWGRHTIQFCKHGFRLDDPSREYAIVMKAPDWQVHYFSDARKIIFSAPITRLRAGFSQRMGMLTGDTDRNPTHWQKLAKKTPDIVAFPVIHYQLYKGKNGAPLPKKSNLQVFIASTISVDAQVSELFANLYDLPSLGGVPLRAITGQNTVRLTMDTHSAKTIVVPPMVLIPPKGYKKVSSAEQVMFQDPSFF